MPQWTHTRKRRNVRTSSAAFSRTLPRPGHVQSGACLSGGGGEELAQRDEKRRDRGANPKPDARRVGRVVSPREPGGRVVLHPGGAQEAKPLQDYLQKARELLKTSLDVRPGNGWAYFGLWQVAKHIDGGNPADAEKAFRAHWLGDAPTLDHM